MPSLCPPEVTVQVKNNMINALLQKYKRVKEGSAYHILPLVLVKKRVELQLGEISNPCAVASHVFKKKEGEKDSSSNRVGGVLEVRDPVLFELFRSLDAWAVDFLSKITPSIAGRLGLDFPHGQSTMDISHVYSPVIPTFAKTAQRTQEPAAKPHAAGSTSDDSAGKTSEPGGSGAVPEAAGLEGSQADVPSNASAFMPSFDLEVKYTLPGNSMETKVTVIRKKLCEKLKKKLLQKNACGSLTVRGASANQFAAHNGETSETEEEWSDSEDECFSGDFQRDGSFEKDLQDKVPVDVVPVVSLWGLMFSVANVNGRNNISTAKLSFTVRQVVVLEEREGDTKPRISLTNDEQEMLSLFKRKRDELKANQRKKQRLADELGGGYDASPDSFESRQKYEDAESTHGKRQRTPDEPAADYNASSRFTTNSSPKSSAKPPASQPGPVFDEFE